MSFRIKYDNSEEMMFISFLQEATDTELQLNATYSLIFTFPGVTYSNDIQDQSSNPSDFNKFNITTSISDGVTASNFPIEYQGWCEYSIYLSDNQLDTGKCYIYDNDINVENTPDNTKTHTTIKRKKVYKN